MYQSLKRLLPDRPSLSGDESGIAGRLAEIMRPLCDEVRLDKVGNLICLKRGVSATPSRIMLLAHMDEIGFLVSYIEENGYLRVSPIGGVDCMAAAYSEVVLASGLRGVLVPTADAVERAAEGKALKASELVVDIGADSRRAAAARVSVGEALALPSGMKRLLRKRVMGRPLDDRIGCAILVQIAEQLQDPQDDVYFVFTVQEEAGCMGVAPAAYEIAPEIALNFDVTATGDEQGAKPMAVSLGKGVAVKIRDASVICHHALVEELLELARKEQIPVQCEILPFGGTDTSAVQMTRRGCRACALSVPCRYTHTGVETLDLGDAEAAAALTLAFLGGERK